MGSQPSTPIPSRLFPAIESNDLRLVREELQRMPALLNKRTNDERGMTPLMLACLHGCTEIAIELLKHEGCDVDARDISHGGTALHFAAPLGHLGCVRALLQANCRTDLPDKYGMGALQLALTACPTNGPQSSHDEVVTLLSVHPCCDWLTKSRSPSFVLPPSPAAPTPERTVETTTNSRSWQASVSTSHHDGNSVTSLLSHAVSHEAELDGHPTSPPSDFPSSTTVYPSTIPPSSPSRPSPLDKPSLSDKPRASPSSSSSSSSNTLDTSMTHSSPDPQPSYFVCPITHETMEDPVFASDGFTYERLAIEAWLQEHATSPLTNTKLPNKTLVPNHMIRSAIMEWKEQSRGNK